MQWNKWSEFFCEQIEAIFNDTDGDVKSLLSPTSLNWGTDLEKLEEAHAEEIEAAIFTFLETDEWPTMSRPGLILLNARLQFALGLVEQTQYMAKHWKFGPSGNRRNRADTIQWFLVDAWEKIGFVQLVCEIRTIPHITKKRPETVFGKN